MAPITELPNCTRQALTGSLQAVPVQNQSICCEVTIRGHGHPCRPGTVSPGRHVQGCQQKCFLSHSEADTVSTACHKCTFPRWTPNLEPGRLGWGKLPKPKRAAYNWKKRSSLVSRLVGPLKLTSRARTWIHGSGARTSPTGRRRKRPSSLMGLPRPPALGRMAKMCTHHGRHAVTKSCCC